jgi:hypothetical protein
MLHTSRKQQVTPAIGVAAEKALQEVEQAQYAQVSSMLASLFKLWFFSLLLDKLTTDPGLHFAAENGVVADSILLPYFLYLAVNTALKVITRPRLPFVAEGATVAAEGAALGDRQDAFAFLLQEILKQVLTFVLVYMIAMKLDSVCVETRPSYWETKEYSYSWVQTFGVAFFYLALGFCVCCSGSLAAMSEGLPVVVLFGLCCTLLPVLILATLFLTFLAYDLDGRADYSNSTIFGLLVAFEVFLNLMIILFMVGMEVYLRQSEDQMRLVAGMEDHAMDPRSAETLSAESTAAREQLKETAG